MDEEKYLLENARYGEDLGLKVGHVARICGFPFVSLKFILSEENSRAKPDDP